MRIGSLFSGFGGLDIATREVFGGDLAFVSDIDPAACAVLSHHHPGVPNLGDITTVNWAPWRGRIDVLTGGFPCQDLSTAGLRAGLAGARSGLWGEMARTIDALQPSWVVIENVGGITSAQALRDVEPCPWCVGDKPIYDVRALGVVLADLADIGYDAAWCGLRASDVGACHRRFRVFILASPADADRERRGKLRHRLASISDADRRRRPHGDGNQAESPPLLPTPTAQLAANGGSQHPDKRRAGGHQPTLADVVEHLLPTPSAADGLGGHERRGGARSGELLLPGAVKDHGRYAAAIRRWEALTRPAPPPTTPTGRGGTHRLNAQFDEWMMGLPDGWVTDVPGLTRRQQLHALGNGVVPQQATAAISYLLEVIS